MAVRQFSRWCIRPDPEEDELLSSWLHRLAVANAIKDHTFCRYMFGSTPIWTRDIDRSFSEECIQQLSDWTDVSSESISELKLTRWTGRVAEVINPNGLSLWILPIGVYHRLRRQYGLQFCSGCLRDSEANSLWMWRMAWSTCCLRHEQSLQDRCPFCSAPYIPHRSSPCLFGRACCYACGRDLAQQDPATVLASSELDWQKHFEEAVRSGATTLDGKEFLALPLFEGLRTILRVILSTRWKSLRSYFLIGEISVNARKTKPQFEFESNATRRQILFVAWELLRQWPTCFVNTMQLCKIPSWAFVREDHVAPFWLQQALDDLPLKNERTVITEQEILSVCRWLDAQEKPISASSVKRTLGLKDMPSRGVDLKAVLTDYCLSPEHHRSK